MMTKIREQAHIFFNALVFFTRIPSPNWVIHTPDYQHRAAYFAPLIGWLVGGVAALVFALTVLVLPATIAILLSMTATIWLTGAFHEDGLADVCDGFGGGHDAASIKRIMKDSRVGSYAVVGLMMVLLLKYVALTEIVDLLIANGEFILTMPLILLAGHSVSRFAAVSFIYTHDYVSSDEEAKSTTITRRMSNTGYAMADITGLLPLLVLAMVSLPYALAAVVPMVLGMSYFSRLFRRRLKGYSGDCLGAVQQVTEVIFYLSISTILHLQRIFSG